MNFGRISTSKCRGMLQKMGCCTPNPPKKPRPLLHARALKNKLKRNKIKNLQAQLSRQRPAGRRPLRAMVALLATANHPAVARPGATSGRRPLVVERSVATDQRLPSESPFFVFSLPPSSCPQNFAHVVNSSSLAPTHARPTQTSPKNFKHP
jgi:hypothetical protein